MLRGGGQRERRDEDDCMTARWVVCSVKCGGEAGGARSARELWGVSYVSLTWRLASRGWQVEERRDK